MQILVHFVAKDKYAETNSGMKSRQNLFNAQEASCHAYILSFSSRIFTKCSHNERPPRLPSAPGLSAKIIFDVRSFTIFEMPLALTNIYIELFTKFNDIVRFGNSPSIPNYKTFWFSYIYNFCYALRFTLYINNASKKPKYLIIFNKENTICPWLIYIHT